MINLMTLRHMTPEKRRLEIQQEEEEGSQRQRAVQERIRQQKLEQIRRQRELQLRFYDNPRLFLDTPGLYCYDPDGSISSQDLYQIYRKWCLEQRIPLATPREFWLKIRKYAPEYALSYCILTGISGKRCRGFRGICALVENTENTDGTDQEKGIQS